MSTEPILDSSLRTLTEISDRYIEQDPLRQRDILKQVVRWVIINPEGQVIRMELHPPFNYLFALGNGGRKLSGDSQSGSPVQGDLKTETGGVPAGSTYVFLGSPNGALPYEMFLDDSGLNHATQLLLFITYYERDHSAKLTTQERNQIIRQRHSQGEHITDLAREFGITPQRVDQLVKPKRNR